MKNFPTINSDMTILEAIGLGFGLTEFADNSKVKVIRTVNDVSQIGYVNLLDENLISSLFYLLQPNDVFVVPPLKLVTAIIFFKTIEPTLANLKKKKREKVELFPFFPF